MEFDWVMAGGLVCLPRGLPRAGPGAWDAWALQGAAAVSKRKPRPTGNRTLGNILFGPLIANARRSIRKALGLSPQRGRRWNKKINKAGKRYWTAACRERDCGLLISATPEGYVLKTIREGEFVEIRTMYTLRGAKQVAERFARETR